MRRLVAAALWLLFGSQSVICYASSVLPGDWPYHGRDQEEQRYSPLSEIDQASVTKLGLVWYQQFDTDRGQEATPIEAHGVLYTTTAWSIVYAFDAATGKPLWRYDPAVPRQTLAGTCCDAVNRGVALLEGRVFVATLDGRLIALDAATGKLGWSVDTLDHRRPKMHYTITGAPRVVKDKILIGNGGGEFGVRGYVTAYEAKTGKLAWRFYLVPNPEGQLDGAASDAILQRLAAKTWSDGEWKTNGGGGAAWDSMTYDPVADLIYVGAGNTGPFDWQRRSNGQGDNLFGASIVALNPDTGGYVWHYQNTPADSWDYDATQQMMAATLQMGGASRNVLMQAAKNGFFYILDRRTGRLLSAEPFVPVTWASGVDLKTGRPQEAPRVHYETGPSIQQPGPLGAHSWQAMSYSPRTGLIYIPVQISIGDYERAPDAQARPVGANTEIAMPSFPEAEGQLAAIRAATKGQLLAWDPISHKARWSVSRPWFLNGGTLATAGDLVFQGTADGEFAAYDALTGQQLWSYAAGNGIIAPPISYAIDGKQYIAIMVGFGGAGALIGKIVPDQARLPGRLLVFTIGGSASTPPYKVAPLAPITVAGANSAGDAAAGEVEYNRTCSVCHGGNASVRYTADLRRSGFVGSEAAWRSVVIDGVLRERGMIGFGAILTPPQAENIRAYVLQEARRAASPPEGTESR